MKKVIAISFALILLVSNISLTIGAHYCGGEVVKTRIMLGETHLDCGMAEMDETCNDFAGHGLEFDKPPCCENRYQTFQVDNDFNSYPPLSILNVDFIIALVHSDIVVALFSKAKNSFYTDYSPPPLIKDLPVLFRTFLI